MRTKPIRILVIGDSISRGLYASSETLTYKYLIADELDAILGWMPGTTLETARCNWETWRWKADVILVELGTNDMNGTLPENIWVSQYGEFLDLLKASGAIVIVGTIPWAGWPLGTERYLRAVRYNNYIKDAATMRNIPVADLWSATYALPRSSPNIPSPFAPHFVGDGFHPGDGGHRKIADTFIAQIRIRVLYLPLIYRRGLLAPRHTGK